jgi:hypothetical protein
VYPPAGAMIDYWLAAPATSFRMEILDAKGAVVRAFASGDSGAAPRGGRGGGAGAGPSANAGLNRFVWDMTYNGPGGAGGGFGRGGPMAAPGNFTVRYTANGITSTQPLVLKADPRVLLDGVTQAGMEAQLAFNLKVRDLVTESNRVGLGLRSLNDKTLNDEFFTPPIRYSRPGLQAHIAYLYSMTLGADQKVGRDAMDRYAELKKALDVLKAKIPRA